MRKPLALAIAILVGSSLAYAWHGQHSGAPGKPWKKKPYNKHYMALKEHKTFKNWIADGKGPEIPKKLQKATENLTESLENFIEVVLDHKDSEAVTKAKEMIAKRWEKSKPRDGFRRPGKQKGIFSRAWNWIFGSNVKERPRRPRSTRMQPMMDSKGPHGRQIRPMAGKNPECPKNK